MKPIEEPKDRTGLWLITLVIMVVLVTVGATILLGPGVWRSHLKALDERIDKRLKRIEENLNYLLEERMQRGQPRVQSRSSGEVGGKQLEDGKR